MSEKNIAQYNEEEGEVGEEEGEGEGEGEEEGEFEGEVELDYGEAVGTVVETRLISEYVGEAEQERELFDFGELGEGGGYFFYAPITEGPSIWAKKSSSTSEVESIEPGLDIEETEEERELRKEREALIEDVRQKIMERMAIRKRNAYLHKKLVEHFKKRRMENVFKEDPKGLDLDKKYLKRLQAFKDFKQFQENEMEELANNLTRLEAEANDVEQNLDDKLGNFVVRAKDVSLNLILAKTGKKLSEKEVDRILKRFVNKNAEKGAKKLQYIEIKNLIEEKERELKSMEYIEEGLYVGDYEQMKIDNQNLTDKIEEKEDELTKMRLKTQEIMQTLAQVREKEYAIEGDIELMAEKVYAVEKQFSETRKRLTEARKKRDNLREELGRQKLLSGLLTRDALLRDFELSIAHARTLAKELESLKKLMHEKTKQEVELNRAFATNSEVLFSQESKSIPRKVFRS